jgi:predicted RNA-binding protein with PUA-like domain
MQEIKEHDRAFFYHSGCPDAGIYGLINITSGPYPDETARQRRSKYFDQRAVDGNNPWSVVDVEFVKRYKHPLLIPQLNALGLEYHPKRLSVIKISDEQFGRIEAELEARNRE